MTDVRYCYPDSNVLINKLNITNRQELFEAEVELTSIRLQELQQEPIKGDFDFNHLKAIHKYIFQDLYEWAGKERTVDIGKGNLFCTVPCIQDYARSVFGKYFSQCYAVKDSFDDFVRTFADNYGDLNALHPFREGNGRAQREFARLVCVECGYNFDLSCTTHEEMLKASKLSFDQADSSAFIEIFTKALALQEEIISGTDRLKILTFDDLTIETPDGYDYYDYGEYAERDLYNEIYRAKINKMTAEMAISDAKDALKQKNTLPK
ncbi:MAG: Fic family protein [Lachnospiraceae bacterium]|nr:Fic family protein [Lachnospiraceae bacterium]